MFFLSDQLILNFYFFECQGNHVPHRNCDYSFQGQTPVLCYDTGFKHLEVWSLWGGGVGKNIPDNDPLNFFHILRLYGLQKQHSEINSRRM